MTTTRPDPLVQSASEPASIPARGSVEPRETFEGFYAQRYDAMVRLAYVLVDTNDEAEQVVQDAFMALFRRYDEIEHPPAYLRASVVNGARKVLRRRRLLRRTVSAPSVDAELGFDHVADAVRRLPVEQRVLVALRYEQQLTDSEISEVMSMPIGTVKSRLHRAITTLREEIR